MKQNRRRWASLVIWCLFLVLPLCVQRDAVAQERGKKWALIIGIDDYANDNITPLKCAVADAKAIADALIKNAGFGSDDVSLMTSDVNRQSSDYPSSTRVLRRFDDLARQIQPEDTFVFYFSGHGFQKANSSFLATVDANPGTIDDLKRTSIYTEVLKEKMSSIAARKVVFINDACRNDPEKARGDSDYKMSADLARDLRLAVSRSTSQEIASTAVLYSCSPGQRAFEWGERGHGVFTNYFLEGLQGAAAEADGSVNISGLMDFVQKNVMQWAKDNNKEQTPLIDMQGAGRIVLVPRGAKNPGGDGGPRPIIDLKRALLRVSSTPQGAKVYIDGAQIEDRVTPCDVSLDIGQKTKDVVVDVEMLGFRRVSKYVTLERGATTPLVVPLERIGVPCTMKVRLEMGSEIPVALTTPLSDTKSRINDVVRGVVKSDVVGPNGEILISHGAAVTGKVTAVRAGYVTPTIFPPFIKSVSPRLEFTLDETTADDGSRIPLAFKKLESRNNSFLSANHISIPANGVITAQIAGMTILRIDGFCDAYTTNTQAVSIRTRVDADGNLVNSDGGRGGPRTPDGKTVVGEKEKIPQNLCKVRVTSVPDGARVFVDGNMIADKLTPCELVHDTTQKLAVRISVSKTGYENTEGQRDVTLAGGQTVDVNFGLISSRTKERERRIQDLRRSMQEDEQETVERLSATYSGVEKWLSTEQQNLSEKFKGIREALDENRVPKEKEALLARLKTNREAALSVFDKERAELAERVKGVRGDLGSWQLSKEELESTTKTVNDGEASLNGRIKDSNNDLNSLYANREKALLDSFDNEAHNARDYIRAELERRKKEGREAWLKGEKETLTQTFETKDREGNKLLQEGEQALMTWLQEEKDALDARLKDAKDDLPAFYEKEEADLKTRFDAKTAELTARLEKSTTGLQEWLTQSEKDRLGRWEKTDLPGLTAEDKEALRKDAATRQEAFSTTMQNRSVRLLSILRKQRDAHALALQQDKVVKIEDSGVPYGSLWLQRTITGHTAAVNDVVFSRDNQIIATASTDKTVKLWNANTGALLRTLAPHWAAVNSVAFSPNGKLVASGCWDKVVRIWSISGPATATPVAVQLLAHTGPVTSVVFSPDGTQLASGSEDKTIIIWDVKSGKPLKTLSGHEDRVREVAFTADGKFIVSCSNDKTINVWNVETGQPERSLTGFNYSVGALGVSPDGKVIAGASGGSLWLKNAETGDARGTLAGGQNISSVSFSPDGNAIAAGGEDSSVVVWGVMSGRQKAMLSSHKGRVNAVAFSPDGMCVASASSDETVKLWRATPKTP